MKKSTYTKLRDRVAYEKVVGDWTLDQVANAEAVLANYQAAPSPQKSEKKNLTDRKLKALKSEAADRDIPYDVMDASLRSFGVRRFPNREVVFIVYRRIGGSRKPTRRKLGRFPEMSLDEARTKAEEWLLKIRRGKDPSLELAREAAANVELERRRSANSFKAALEAYYRHKADEGLRSIDARKVAMNRELAPWMTLSLQDITEDEIRRLVTAIKDRGHPAQALATKRLINSLFSWICAHGGFGLKAKDNPCLGIGTKALAGTSKVRQRYLSNEEIVAFLHACDKLAYPGGSYLRLLLMTSLRRKEAAKMHWDEIDLAARTWIVPGQRMKKTKPSDPDRDHLVPLTPDLIEFLATIPRFDGFVFSNCGGKKAITDYVGVKAEIDTLMKAELGAKFKAWQLHDLRRTARRKYSELGIPEHIGEKLLAHTKVDHYNTFEFEQEKRDGLLIWHDYLRNIDSVKVEPMPSLAA